MPNEKAKKHLTLAVEAMKKCDTRKYNDDVVAQASLDRLTNVQAAVEALREEKSPETEKMALALETYGEFLKKSTLGDEDFIAVVNAFELVTDPIFVDIKRIFYDRLGRDYAEDSDYLLAKMYFDLAEKSDSPQEKKQYLELAREKLQIVDDQVEDEDDFELVKIENYKKVVEDFLFAIDKQLKVLERNAKQDTVVLQVPKNESETAVVPQTPSEKSASDTASGKLNKSLSYQMIFGFALIGMGVAFLTGGWGLPVFAAAAIGAVGGALVGKIVALITTAIVDHFSSKSGSPGTGDPDKLQARHFGGEDFQSHHHDYSKRSSLPLEEHHGKPSTKPAVDITGGKDVNAGLEGPNKPLEYKEPDDKGDTKGSDDRPYIG